jgi:hypothetical protein
MFIYNVHSPSKTFALAAKENEDCSTLIERIIAKARLSGHDADAVRNRIDGAGVVYEFEGDRWALEDDDDLAIVTARFRSDAESHPTPSITLHVVQPSSPDPMASNGLVPPPAYRTPSTGVAKPQGRRTSHAGSVAGSVARSQSARQAANDGVVATTTLCIPNAEKNRSRSVGARSVRSMRSTTSRRSKWGDDNAEPLGDVKRRQFEEFHANNGVRTVVGKVGNVDNVRMLLKAGYRNIYLSRAFAVRHGLLSKKHGPGMGGYTGLKILGNVPITVGSRTAVHNVMLSEEQHFDVVLGRQWVEKMVIKVDPLDPTLLTYMDTGETIPCDLVVLRDAQGEIITIT